MDDLVAIVPVNRLERAKGRISDVLDAHSRRRLALATLETVLGALREADMRALVLTADAEAAAAATAAGAETLPEEGELPGLNAQLEWAIERLAPAGSVLILHADLPLATAAALGHLAAVAPPPPSATLVRSSDGGTNAMLLRPAGRFALAYGPGSFARHAQAAAQAGYRVRHADIPALALDLDTGDDLAVFRAHPEALRTPAGRVLGAVSRGWGQGGAGPAASSPRSEEGSRGR